MKYLIIVLVLSFMISLSFADAMSPGILIVGLGVFIIGGIFIVSMIILGIRKIIKISNSKRGDNDEK